MKHEHHVIITIYYRVNNNNNIVTNCFCGLLITQFLCNFNRKNIVTLLVIKL